MTFERHSSITGWNGPERAAAAGQIVFEDMPGNALRLLVECLFSTTDPRRLAPSGATKSTTWSLSWAFGKQGLEHEEGEGQPVVTGHG